MGVHDGHRARLKNRFVQFGLDSFNDINILEFLLFFSIPRKDTNEVAHRLIDHFGSLHEVFNASIKELTDIQGVTFNSAVLITFIPQLLRKIEISKTSEVKVINSYRDAGEYLVPRFINERDELLLMLCLDSRRRVINCNEIARGSVDTVEVNVRKIVETAFKDKAVSVILAHNHPGGVPLPSIEDSRMTKRISDGLRTVAITLEDHIIVAGDKFASMYSSGVMFR